MLTVLHQAWDTAIPGIMSVILWIILRTKRHKFEWNTEMNKHISTFNDVFRVCEHEQSQTSNIHYERKGLQETYTGIKVRDHDRFDVFICLRTT